MNKRIFTSIAAVALFGVSTLSSSAQEPLEPGRYFYGPRMMWWDGGWSGMIFGPVFMLLLFVGAVALVMLLTRRPTQADRGPAQGRSPIDILKARFARGEIDKAEFEERRRVLGD